MQALRTIVHELFAMFVADARFTLTLVAGIVTASMIPALLPHHPVLGALLFFFGLAGILVENVVHTAAVAEQAARQRR